jgi:hypothetical protein
MFSKRKESVHCIRQLLSTMSTRLPTPAQLLRFCIDALTPSLSNHSGFQKLSNDLPNSQATTASIATSAAAPVANQARQLS